MGALLAWLHREYLLWWASEFADRAGLSPALVRAVIWVESRGIPVQKLDTNGHVSYGVMQVQVPAASDVGFRGDPARLMGIEGIRYGVRYLAHQIRRYGGDVSKGVGAYNAGNAADASPEYVGKVADALAAGRI